MVVNKGLKEHIDPFHIGPLNFDLRTNNNCGIP